MATAVAVLCLLTGPVPSGAVPTGYRQTHSTGGGNRWFTEFNVWGKCGVDNTACKNDNGWLAIRTQLETYWLQGKALAGAAAVEICNTQAYDLSIYLTNHGYGYAAVFWQNRTLSITPITCPYFGTAVFALGGFVANSSFYFASQDPAKPSITKGAACVRAYFLGNYSACSFHMAAGQDFVAANQVIDLIAGAAVPGRLDAARILAGDSQLTPFDQSSVMNQMGGSNGYSEADGSPGCLPWSSCAAEQTFNVKNADELEKIDYVFAKGYVMIPRAEIYADPIKSDHSMYTAYR